MVQWIEGSPRDRERWEVRVEKGFDGELRGSEFILRKLKTADGIPLKFPVKAVSGDELHMFVRLGGAGEWVAVVEPKAVHLRESPAPSLQIFNSEKSALVNEGVGGEDSLWRMRGEGARGRHGWGRRGIYSRRESASEGPHTQTGYGPGILEQRDPPVGSL